jgi:hypothetical protein
LDGGHEIDAGFDDLKLTVCRWRRSNGIFTGRF